MTTGVFRREIYMTPLHSPGPKIGGRCKQGAIIFCGAKLYSILSQNSLPWQQGLAGEKFK